MSTVFNFDVNLTNSVSMGLAILGRDLTGQESLVLSKSVGVAVAQMVARHFSVLDQERHHPLSPTHFYGDAARAVLSDDAVQPYLGGVAIIIDHEGIVQRYYGGEILPKVAKYLAIPAREEQYGRRPRDADNPPMMPLIRWRDGALRAVALVFTANVARVLSRGPRKGQTVPAMGEDALLGEGGIAYWLVDRVYQNPDETVLPTDEAILGAAQIAATAYLDDLAGLWGNN